MHKRIKVLYIPLWYPSNGTSKMSGVFNREHVRAMAPFVDVTVINFISDVNRRTLKLDIIEFEDAGIKTIEIRTGLSPIHKTSIFTWSYNLYKAIDAVIKKNGRPDILHAQDDNSWIVGLYAQKHKLPYVISQHWTKILEGQLNYIEKLLYKKSFKYAGAILPAQFNAKEEYKKQNLFGNVIWLPNVYNPDIFKIEEKSRRNILLHVSGMIEQKRTGDIIRAFQQVIKEIPQAILLLVGEGKGKLVMQSLANKLLPKSNFEFTGYLTKNKIAELMQTSKGLIFPSQYETFGCVLMEAMACGTPVLTTKVGGIPGVVPDKKHGILVEVGNIDQIRDGMLRMLNDTHDLNIESIANRSKEIFSSRAVGKRIMEIYKSVLIRLA